MVSGCAKDFEFARLEVDPCMQQYKLQIACVSVERLIYR